MPALNHSGNVLDEVSDAVDHGRSRLYLSFSLLTFDPPHRLASVNVLKGKLWNEESQFDETKDKGSFRQYDSACERVNAFYKEQHGEYCSPMRLS